MVTDGARLAKNSKTFEGKLMGVRSPPPGTISNQAPVATWNMSVEEPDAKLCQFCVSAT